MIVLPFQIGSPPNENGAELFSMIVQCGWLYAENVNISIHINYSLWSVIPGASNVEVEE